MYSITGSGIKYFTLSPLFKALLTKKIKKKVNIYRFMKLNNSTEGNQKSSLITEEQEGPHINKDSIS